jgi:hypothetical protein
MYPEPQKDQDGWYVGVDEVELPAWLSLPEFRPVYTLQYKDNKFLVEDDQGGEVGQYKTAEAAYDENSSENFTWTFDDSLSATGSLMDSGLYFCSSQDKHPSERALISSTDQTLLKLLKSEYMFWAEVIYPSWKSDKSNTAKSFNMLKYHPLFWRKNTFNGFVWSVSNGTDSIELMATESKFYAELGAHVEPEFTEFYHDYRLDTMADSFDELYVILAAKVDKYFTLAGIER